MSSYMDMIVSLMRTWEPHNIPSSALLQEESFFCAEAQSEHGVDGRPASLVLQATCSCRKVTLCVCLEKGSGLPHFLPFLSAEVCGALNVTVSPGPVVDFLEGENATLLCHVSQKRRKDSLLAVRWFFACPNSQEALMVKMTKLRVVQYYGNYSRRASRERLRLLEERRGALYTLSVLTLRPADQGHYVCKVQEISKHRNKWTAWSNGSSATEMRGKGMSTLCGEGWGPGQGSSI